MAATSLAISGCTSVPVLTAVEASPLAVPSAVPEVELADSPVPFIDLPCADMISETELFSALGVTVTPTPPDLTDRDGADQPTSFALESLGGLDCQWTNGQPREIRGAEGPEINPTFIGVTVQAMPNATEEWQLYREYLSSTLEGNFLCSIRDYPRDHLSCTGEELTGTTWVEITLAGSPVEPGDAFDPAIEAARSLWDAALARISSAPPTSVVYAAPADINDLERTCAQFVTREEAQRVLATVDPPFLDTWNGGWSLRGSTYRLANANRCFWVAPDPRWPDQYTYDSVGIMNHFLEGGEWAFERMLEASPNRYNELQLAGLGSGDTAHIDCGRADECTLHLVIGHNWITFSRTEAEASGAVPVGRQSLIRLGELTAARLRG